jgi:hypothetical protein
MNHLFIVASDITSSNSIRSQPFQTTLSGLWQVCVQESVTTICGYRRRYDTHAETDAAPQQTDNSKYTALADRRQGVGNRLLPDLLQDP